MTQNDMTIQELRRENARLIQENKKMQDQHRIDLSEIMRLRRECEAAYQKMEGLSR